MPKYRIGKIGEVERIVDKKGNDILHDPARRQWVVDCINALAEIHSPQAHVNATEDYVKRLEKLRKDAWDEVLLLRTKIGD